MTGLDVVERALLLLGYTTPNGGTDPRQNAEQLRQALPVLNTVLADIRRIQRAEPVRLDSLALELPVEEEIGVLVLVPGVAMYLAQSENDGDNYNRFAQEYAQRRSSVPKGDRNVLDMQPWVRM